MKSILCPIVPYKIWKWTAIALMAFLWKATHQTRHWKATTKVEIVSILKVSLQKFQTRVVSSQITITVIPYKWSSKKDKIETHITIKKSWKSFRRKITTKKVPCLTTAARLLPVQITLGGILESVNQIHRLASNSKKTWRNWNRKKRVNTHKIMMLKSSQQVRLKKA